MNLDDMFLKVEYMAYFPVNGLKIEKREYANDSDANGIYYNNKMIMPDIKYYLYLTDGETGYTEDLPKRMALEPDHTSYQQEFVTRAKLWEEEPSCRRMDEIIEEFQTDSERNS